MPRLVRSAALKEVQRCPVSMRVAAAFHSFELFRGQSRASGGAAELNPKVSTQSPKLIESSVNPINA